MIPFGNIYKGKRILVTGHTGFKGSWLSFWLDNLGAEVAGYSLPPPTQPNHFELLKLDIKSIFSDIRDREKLNSAIKRLSPDIVFHLAAQPLVRQSYKNPIETFETNIIGTANLLEACRHVENIKAIVIITSDKCYENRELSRGYRESDPMGGYDPYSSSKGCAELITNSYRNSFFNHAEYGSKHNKLLATVRAGNVIGGGDWAEDRLIPDIIKAAAGNEKVLIRNPNATRPWQHVIEPLYGYLLLGQKLLEGKKDYAEAWNLGPNSDGNLKVLDVLMLAKECWSNIDFEIDSASGQCHESDIIRLDCSKAHIKLGWKPSWNIEAAVKKTMQWYKEFYENGRIITSVQIKEYCEQI